MPDFVAGLRGQGHGAFYPAPWRFCRGPRPIDGAVLVFPEDQQKH